MSLQMASFNKVYSSFYSSFIVTILFLQILLCTEPFHWPTSDVIYIDSGKSLPFMQLHISDRQKADRRFQYSNSV